ncbi:OmpA family protein [Bdellovibrio sp. NC01]|uniref:OmpA family protein n=1 Tax=Bdellovibrio sp. NC01 TaxID=2220073 RepID=UPI00115762AF|nr:OmpA family protein [Bdellovibrio sp. NC01]QDK38547.1 OmpA family protein [Bdellovibrio sp. NC01]
MKKMIVMASMFAVILSACATIEDNKKTAAGAGIGAVVGGVAGAVIGHQTGNRNAGALIGATLGAGVGGLIGNRLDKQQKELEKIAETKRTEQGLITKLKSDILFDTGKADLKPAAKENINQLAAIMKKYPENVLTIKGYTDSTGSDKVNKPLSEKRAQAVRDQLLVAGIPANTVSSLGMGSENPVDASKSKDAYAKNRRVEIEITVDESKVPKQKGA